MRNKTRAALIGPLWVLVLLLGSGFGTPLPAQNGPEEEIDEIIRSDDPEDLESLSDLSLEDLLNIEVTSVSRKRQKASQAAAAIHVLTQEDIQRAGARSLPEALRLVPGVEVAQINRHRWAVSIRGFNDFYASKLLVLIDGRSVYTPLFSGVFWNQQIVPVESIERIEVIRGPGGTLWGANAVNGVINVITKSAKESQGGQFRAVAGDSELESYLRYGFALGEDMHVKLHGSWFDRHGFETAADDEHDWTSFQGGARLDWAIDVDDELTLQVDAFDGEAEQEFSLIAPTPPTFNRLIDDVINFSGVNAMARWRHEFDEDQDIILQVYFDHTRRNEEAFEDRRDTWDLDFQHRFKPADSHEIVWGVGYRFISDDFRGSYALGFDPDDRNYQIFSFFVQDEWTLIEDELRLIFGTKIEHNDFSGFEFQPNIRLLWNIDEQNTIWAAASRAVETPSRASHDLRLRLPLRDLGGGFIASGEVQGDPDVVATGMLAFELGWRSQPFANLSLDLALFYNDYEHVLNRHNGVPFFDPAGYPVVPLINDNGAKAETYGLELTTDWRPLDELRLTASWSLLQVQVHPVGIGSNVSEGAESVSPHHRLVVRALWNPRDDLDFSGTIYWTDNLQGAGIPSYFRLDLQVRWRPLDELEVGAGVRNLLDDRHPEFGDLLNRTPAEVQRTIYFWLDYRF